MTVESRQELEGLQAAGRVVAQALRRMRAAVAPGVTTGALDAPAAETFAAAGARSGPQLDYDFPGVTCISVNDEAVHGVPSDRRLSAGDLVKLDVTAELDGFYADACVTAAVGAVDPQAKRLLQTARRALSAALRGATAGTPLNVVGGAVEDVVRAEGFAVCRALTGHGIGRRIHEPPSVYNYNMPEARERLHPGLVLTIEPIISTGSGEVVDGDDGWTIRTADAALSAHAEHTIMITTGAPVVLTA
jgi:methionyl aminopeptidase